MLPETAELLDGIAEAVLLADAGDTEGIGAAIAGLDALRASGVVHGAGAEMLDECRARAAALSEAPLAHERTEILGELGKRLDALRAWLRQSTIDAAALDAAAALAADPALIADFIDRATEHADEAERQALFLDHDPSDRESLNAAFRAFHTVKGMAGFLALDDIQTICHDAESVLDAPRHGEDDLTSDAVQSLLASVDALRDAISAVGAPASATQETSAQAAPLRDVRHDARTVRVDEVRLDSLLETIGELVVAHAMVAGATDGLIDAWGPVAQRFGHLGKIARELQDMSTSLRMVPLRATVRKMARLVRDLARDVGKQVEFTATGDDTELDRGLVDVVDDALVHLFRNAVDHGIETPSERAAAGKPAAGQVSLAAYHEGGSVHIEVSDDGRGIDSQRVVERACALGLLGEDEQPTEREAMALIMAPGFSTAEHVTAVSGRGVGMDAVRRIVEDLHGQIDITSELGRGSRFHMRVPLTLAIMDGMVVRVGGERYIIPTASILRSVRPEPSALTQVVDLGLVMTTESGFIPIISLAEIFDIREAEMNPANGIVVVVSNGDKLLGIAACELLGQQQVVVKPLGETFRGISGLAGGAIMPDGTVGLILEVGGLVSRDN